jgi:hypothetical protein
MPRPSYAFAAALAVTGATCLVIAVTHQREARPVPMSAPMSAPEVVPADVIASRDPVPVPVKVPATDAPVATPMRVVIPAIGVGSDLLSLGQAADGSLAAPPPGPHYDQAGWYRYSPRPGAVGPAVIVGHIDSKSGGPSVFFRLGELRPHDRIDVTRADGTVAVFAVDDVRRFHKADFPTQLVYGNTDHAALRLITCGGPFDRTTGHYLDNVVVTASLVRTG